MNDDLHGLTGAYVLDAVGSEERAFFERHLASCASCRAEVRELREAAAALAGLAEEPPPQRMRAAVLTAIADIAQEDPTDRLAQAVPKWSQRNMPAVAGILAVAVLTLGAALALLLVDRAQSPTLAELAEDARVLALTGDEGERGAVLYHRGDAVLVVTGLQPLPEAETYQAWVIHDDQPQSAGLLSTAPEGTGIIRLQDSVETADAIAVSREPAGGSEGQPQGPIVLSWAGGEPSAEP